MKKQFLIIAVGSASLLFGFQNCGSKFQFKDSTGASAATKIDNLTNHILVTNNSGPTNPTVTLPGATSGLSGSPAPTPKKNVCRTMPINDGADNDKDKDSNDKSKAQSQMANSHSDKDHEDNEHEGDNQLCKDKENDGNKDDYKKLVECRIMDKKISLAQKSSLDSDQGAPKAKVCMTKNACLNIVNLFAHPRNCELVKDVASKASENDCTDEVEESSGSCEDGVALSDDDVKKLLSNISN